LKKPSKNKTPRGPCPRPNYTRKRKGKPRNREKRHRNGLSAEKCLAHRVGVFKKTRGTSFLQKKEKKLGGKDKLGRKGGGDPEKKKTFGPPGKPV